MTRFEIAQTMRQQPLLFGKTVWPQVTFYKQQIETIHSVRDNDETVVVAGNQLGKDFTAGFIVVWYFLTHVPCRVVTTSVKDDHLRVLWGEIGWFLQNAKLDNLFGPLISKEGGPLIIRHRDIRRLHKGYEDPISYVRGMVSEKGEGLAGHHAQYTLGIIDEASGVENMVYTQMATWAKKILIFGNPNPCDKGHFFRKAVIEGDILAA